jgi:hypothetical protein
MRDRTPWLKLLGGVWLIVGISALAWVAFSLQPALFEALFGLGLKSPDQGLLSALYIPPWAQLTVSTLALFLLLVGWGLMQRFSWVQTLMVPAHLLFVVYAILGWVALYVTYGGSYVGTSGLTLLLAAFMLINIGLAIFMSSVSATEALSWFPLRTAPAIPLTCEFCGSQLDPETNQCPQCETIPEIVHKHVAIVPPNAKLIDLADESEFWIEPDKAALVGRGSAGNDINLSNPTVSRHHAKIEFEEGHFVLTALRDSNGTFVNDTLIRQRTLRDGDEIRFGRARFQFTILEPTPPC